MAFGSNSWKALERLVAKVLRGERVLRGGDFSKKDVDVKVEDFPNLQIDAKYRQRWAHHRFVDTVEEKYCVADDDMGILVTKHPRQRGCERHFTTGPLWVYFRRDTRVAGREPEAAAGAE